MLIVKEARLVDRTTGLRVRLEQSLPADEPSAPRTFVYFNDHEKSVALTPHNWVVLRGFIDAALSPHLT